MKKFLTTLFLLLIFAFPTYSYADDKSYTVDFINTNAVIMENGDVQVTEELKYNFSGEFNGIYRDLELDGCSGYTISDVYAIDNNNEKHVISNSSSNENYTYEVLSEDNAERIKIYCKSSNEIKSFYLVYTINKAAKKYTDVGELYWNFYDVNDDIDEVKEAILTLSLNNTSFTTDTFNCEIFGDGEISSNISKDNITINYDNLSSLMGVKLQFQKDFLSTLSEESISSEEAHSNRGMKIALGTISAAVIILIIFFYIKKKKFNKALMKYRSEYIFISDTISAELPSDLSPALVNVLFNIKYVSAEALSSTLFYLAHKGYYTISEIPSTNSSYADVIFERTTKIDLPTEEHLSYLLNWFGKYEKSKKFSINKISKRLLTEANALDFQKEKEEWESLILKDAESLHYFTDIKGKKVLTNEYYNEYLKWKAYKEYLKTVISDDINETSLDTSLSIMYASVLGISEKRIKELDSMFLNIYKTESTPVFCNNYLFYMNRFNFLESNLSNSTSSSTSVSSGSSFSGGGGGGSGAF